MISAARLSSRCINTQIVKAKNVASLHNSTKLLSKETATPKAPPKKVVVAEQDPHQLADEMVRNAPDITRISGTEALQSITAEQKMKNYGMAVGLASFCVGVWYYSILAVGKPEGGIDELRAEAQEALVGRDRMRAEEKNAEELAQLDVTLSSYGDDDMIVAVAAPDDIAQQEEEAMAGGKKKSGRPLWKKVVLFWKKE